ncbi:hypothetical protein ACFXJ5_36675 [Streptomyces sp. NPDC059373]
MTDPSHPTASAFVYCRVEGSWRMGVRMLALGPLTAARSAQWGTPSLPVAQAESPDAVALRAVTEQLGVVARLVTSPVPVLPDRRPGRPKRPDRPCGGAPWWVVHLPAPADAWLSGPHLHVDHQYVAVAGRPADPAPSHLGPFLWVAADQLLKLPVRSDVKMVGRSLFRGLDGVLAGEPDPALLDTVVYGLSRTRTVLEESAEPPAW